MYAKGASRTAQKQITSIHQGRCAAEVEGGLIDDDTGWAPSLSVADARKRDAVRFAREAGRIAEAAALARVFQSQPVSQRDSA